MTNTLQLATIFFAQLGFGSAMILPFFPIKVTGKSFLRFYYGFIVIFLAFFIICLIRLNQFHYNYLIISALAVWSWVMAFTKSFTKTEQVLMWVFAFCSLVLLFSYPQKYFFHAMAWTSYFIPFLLMLSGTIFLCFFLMNMIFGHWYLINRKLPIDHLIKTSRNLIFFTYLRLITVGISVYIAYTTMSISAFHRLTDFMGHGVFFWARILVGIGLPLLVAHLSYESAKIKSNQSATGILYAGMVFVFMGEIMGLYLFTLTGIVF